MADLPAAVRSRLLAASTVTAITNRIYWTIRPQGAPLPSIVLQEISGTEDQLLEGPGDMIETRIQVAGLSLNGKEARTLALRGADALRFEAEQGGILFWNAQVDRPRGGGGDDTPDGFIYRTTVDVILRHTADVAA